MDQVLDTKAKSTWSPSCIIARAYITSEDQDGFRNFFLEFVPKVLLGTVHRSLEAFLIFFPLFLFHQHMLADEIYLFLL